MGVRDSLAEIFADTRMRYESEADLMKSAELSKMFCTVYPQDEAYQSRPKPSGPQPTVTVSSKRSFEAAKALVDTYGSERVAVHNFASATNPGGGVIRGASAQEESLCRCSTLYASLDQSRCWDQFYQYHRNLGDFRYSDACIFSPHVCVFKTDEPFPQPMDKDDWYQLNVITCAAPNLYPNPYIVSEQKLYELHVRRGRQILGVAADNNIEALILGAFGCGAFRNDPKIVAAAYKQVLADRGAAFKAIEFAIYTPPSGPKTNLEAFQSVFGA